MKTKFRFREGWVMLKRPFEFGELEKPLEKMTILYAYSEKPIIEMELSAEGRELMDEISHMEGRSLFAGGNRRYIKRFGESQDDYDGRMCEEYDKVIKEHKTVENYIGQIVQCEVEGTMCRFFPDEYNVIGQDTFEHVMISEDYEMEIENDVPFDIPEIKTKLFYIMSRGVDKSMAQRMASKDMKDSVIFRPGLGVLQMFCRPDEIYNKTKRELIYGSKDR